MSKYALSKKVAIYIRVSTHMQADKDSLKVQRRELIAYCTLVLGIQDYEIFEDPGYSAKNTDRPDYQRMMDRLRAGEFSHLLVWKIDRISRNLLDFAAMHMELKQIGVTFVSKNEQFDTSTAIGEAMLKIILVFAELERQMTSERVTAVMLSRANNGQWNGGRIPYGYNYDKQTKTFEINAEESKVYDLICSLYDEYQSLTNVARYLNDHGYRTRAMKMWTATTIRKMLTSDFYTGDYVYNVHDDGKGVKKRDESEWIRIENHHPALTTWEKVDRYKFLLNRNNRSGAGVAKFHYGKNVHIFAGLVSCGSCGANMSATQDRRRADGWRPSIYACAKRRKSKTGCANKYTSDIVLGPFIFNYIANIIRAKDTTTSRSGLQALEKKLLRGPLFEDVESIGTDGLSQLYNLMIEGSTGLEYQPTDVKFSPASSDREALLSRKRKHENAMNRLRSLYLYGDESMPEKDYIIERKRIMDQIEEIDEQLRNLPEEAATFSDAEFIAKASYFVMVQQLLDDRTVDYEKYIRKIDPAIPREFITHIISQITVLDGRITAIQFKNGMKHTFKYRK